MKTFFNLIQEIQKKNRCNHCGGCVTLCSAINCEALAVDNEGRPYFKEIEKCVECGLCYSICSQTRELDDEIKAEALWQNPFGRVIELSVARAKDKNLRDRGVDGGVISAILVRLFETKRIDGAIVSKNTQNGSGSFFAKSKEEILKPRGEFMKFRPRGGSGYGYSTFFPSVSLLKTLEQHSLERVAFVGTPCQVNTIRKMQSLDLVPSDIIQYCFGAFCSGNYYFSEKFLRGLEAKYRFQCNDVEKINIKAAFIITLLTGEQLKIPLQELDCAKSLACDFCDDFSAGYADISFGGTGAPNGWTTAITRTDIGKYIFADTLKNHLEPYRFEDNPKHITLAEKKIGIMSGSKKEKMAQGKNSLENTGIKVIC